MSRNMVLSIPEEDRISDLPYEVLEHILSYLPTKDAVATTFLSKRWKSESVWRSQLNLHFDDKTIPDPSAFRQLLYSVITKRDNTLPIHSFHLNSRHDYNTDFYNFVYSSVITRGVQNLSIDHCNITTTKTFILTTLPTFVLTTKTLSVLKLKTIALNEDDPYFEFDLPSLKVLHLESVAFTYDKHIRKLLSACPILEELETKDLTIKRLAKHLQFDVPSLSNLVTADISGGYIVLDWLHNVQHLRIKLRWVNPLLAMFHNLIHMELRFDSSYPAGFKGGRLIKLLQNSPKLQTMIIDEVSNIRQHYLFKLSCTSIYFRKILIVYNCQGDIEWKDPKIVPECLLSHLTTCSLGNYRRSYDQIQFAKYIMQNSIVLSTMTIQIAKSVKSDTKIQMCKELSLCPRNSATCKLLFI
ncbi:F-box/FBD/LRR-repeat protein At5g56420-like [Trifolium pratense]|uniref:Uncharacterized protein n=1 Tax=Trifolium pratense TaxID=57577 RepID=A0ACB0JGP5_TRIPR|nr:F-box/FBD/LRR-repeat protein At5g56420-like [Trifolium pratense]CAJ2643430.1 unnamed protein product [Trifolium pratense]